MNYNQIVEAYNVLQRFYDMSLPVKKASEILEMIKTLDSEYIKYLISEQNILKECNGKATEDGTIEFVHGDDEESRRIGEENVNKFLQELDKLSNTEVDIEITPVTLSLDSLEDQKITPSEINALSGFVVFE